MFTRLRSLFDNVFTYIFFPTRRIRHKLDSWRSYYICLCKPAFFVSGLVYAHKFVNYAVVLVLITYFTDTWKNNLLKAVAIVNVQEGLSAVLEIFMTNVSVGCLRLRVILYSTAAYIIGLLLFCLSAFQVIPLDNFELLHMLIVIPIAVGKAGGLPILEQYLADQLMAYAFITYFFLVASWPLTFIISASVMGVAYLLLLCGIPFYHAGQQPQSQSPLAIIPRVIKAALLKGHLGYPLIPNQFFKNVGNQLCLSPQIKLFRWLDKAAIIESSSSSPDEQEKAGRLCSVKQVHEMKLLLTMVPMWSAFLGFGLVLSAANTFFS